MPNANNLVKEASALFQANTQHNLHSVMLAIAAAYGNHKINLWLKTNTSEMFVGECTLEFESDWWMMQTVKHGTRLTICHEDSIWMDLCFPEGALPSVTLYI